MVWHLTDEEMEEGQICSDCPGGWECCINLHMEDEYDG